MDNKQQRIARIAVRRTLALIYIINNLNECRKCALYTAEKFPGTERRTLLSSKIKDSKEREKIYSEQIRTKAEEGLEEELRSLEFYLQNSKVTNETIYPHDVNGVVLPHIKNIIEINREDVVLRSKAIDRLIQKLRDCIMDFKEGNIVLTTIENNLKP